MHWDIGAGGMRFLVVMVPTQKSEFAGHDRGAGSGLQLRCWMSGFPKLFLMLLLNVNGRLRHRIVLRGIVHHVLANRFQDQISRNPSVGGLDSSSLLGFKAPWGFLSRSGPRIPVVAARSTACYYIL